MFHQELKICHWWFYVDCESSIELYKMAPTNRPRNKTVENFRLRRNYQSNQYNYNFDIGRQRDRNKVDIGRNKNRNSFDIGRKRNSLRRRRGNIIRRRKERFGRKTDIEDEMETIRNQIYDILSYFR